METLGFVLVIAFAVVLATAFPVAVMAWLEERAAGKVRAARGRAPSRRPAVSTRSAGAPSTGGWR
jgi:hypothetical protein